MKFIKAAINISDGLLTVFKHLFRKPVTLEYPEKRRELNNNFRGKLTVDGCIGCNVCKRVCPSGAISYEKNLNGKVLSYTFDLNKCIFCGNCKYYCPCGAISMTKEYELASANKKDLKLKYNIGVPEEENIKENK